MQGKCLAATQLKSIFHNQLARWLAVLVLSQSHNCKSKI